MLPLHLSGGLCVYKLTFVRLYRSRYIWIKSFGNPRGSPRLLDNDIVLHFLLKILKFSSDGSTSSRSFTFCSWRVGVITLSQLNALTLLRSRIHVEIKIIK
jgi:hypothetical protein